MLKELMSYAEEAKNGNIEAMAFWDSVLPHDATVEKADEFVKENIEVIYALYQAFRKKMGGIFDED